MKKNQKNIPFRNPSNGFSLAEALITLLVVAIITLATIPVITKKHRDKTNVKHGMYACYWNGNTLVAKQVVNGEKTNGTTQFDAKENRFGCVFNPPPGAKNFVVTVVGAGGGGAGSGALRDGKIENFYQVGNHTYQAKETGLYRILAVGAGGGGGGEDTHAVNKRTCTASSGGLVYVPAVVLSKGVSLAVKVGEGGAPGIGTLHSVAAGADGGESSVINNSTSQNFASATGGGGGCSYYLPNLINSHDYYERKIDAWNASGSRTKMGYDFNRSIITGSWETYARRIYSGPAGKGSSDLANAVKINGRRLGALMTYGENGHQNRKYDFNVLPQLSNYNGSFGLSFNNVTRNSRCGTGWQEVHDCRVYTNHFGAGGGGKGYIDGWGLTAQRGVNGFVGLAYRPMYAGLGGNAGKVVQIPYAEMPSKTLLFPGKGGKGGTAAKNIYYRTTSMPCSPGWSDCGVSGYVNNSGSAGKEGQTSYIKNGVEILGGPGASSIQPDLQETYSTLTNSQNFPVGGNGKMADILTSKKVGSGGLGGLNSGDTSNPSINGLTQTVFRNNADISTFKSIYGAGSGGGGGTIGVTNTSVNFGNGGNGSSGLVFIQW